MKPVSLEFLLLSTCVLPLYPYALFTPFHFPSTQHHPQVQTPPQTMLVLRSLPLSCRAAARCLASSSASAATAASPTFLVAPEVAAAVARGDPVVALESTIISHGMPFPANMECALAVEAHPTLFCCKHPPTICTTILPTRSVRAFVSLSVRSDIYSLPRLPTLKTTSPAAVSPPVSPKAPSPPPTLRHTPLREGQHRAPRE